MPKIERNIFVIIRIALNEIYVQLLKYEYNVCWEYDVLITYGFSKQNCLDRRGKIMK